MVIFMPYYRQHGQFLHAHHRNRPSNNTNNSTTTTNINTTTIPMSGYKFASNIFCRFSFSICLFIVSLVLFQFSTNKLSNKKEGSNVIAVILLTIAIVLFLRTCQTLRRYLIIMQTRRRIMQRLRERQLAYEISLAANNNNGNGDIATVENFDLPSYKELFPSHPDISNNDRDPSSIIPPPPSYDDFVKTLVIRHPPAVPFRPHALSLPNTMSLSTPIQSTTTQTNPTRCIWITDRTRRPVCLRGTVTYV